MTDVVIETKHLRKVYGTTAAVSGLDLSVPKASICGFLGRNGAGKTTTMKVLMGMARPNGGTARVFGLDPSHSSSGVTIRARSAFVPEEKPLYDTMTVGDVVRFTASFFPSWDTELEYKYVRTFGLPVDRHVKALSRGMRTKLSLLLALCRRAELLVLDEPTSGLDPAAAEQVLQAIVSQVARDGATVFFSSHQIAEVEQIADEIAIIDEGRSVVNGSVEDVRQNFRRIQLVFAGDAPAHAFVTPGVVHVVRQGRIMTLIATADHERVIAEGRKLMPLSVDVASLTLKDIFLESIVAEEQ